MANFIGSSNAENRHIVNIEAIESFAPEDFVDNSGKGFKDQRWRIVFHFTGEDGLLNWFYNDQGSRDNDVQRILGNVPRHIKAA